MKHTISRGLRISRLADWELANYGIMKFTESKKYKDNLILRETFELSLMVVKFSEELEGRRKFVFANQIIRSGTSIGANVKEAQNAESKKDFVHKLKIAMKEADELEYWLFLCQELESYPNCDELLTKLNSIIKIINKIVSTTKSNGVSVIR